MTPSRILSSLYVTALAATIAAAQGLTDAQVWTVRQRLGEVASSSWEKGTRAQVIIEIDTDTFDVLSTNCQLPPNRTAPSSLNTPLQIARETVQQKPAGSLAFTNDGAAGDPASLGVAVLIANWTGQNDADYASAASQELDYLLHHAPRTSEGAISHRADKVQLWSDFVYMVPPFLAYYGVLQDNTTLMDEAFNQISLYRDQLHDGDSNNLWKHIVQGGDGEDQGRWATGQGWAAMGMLRVMGTYHASPRSKSYGDKQGTLIDWVEEIVDGMYSYTQHAKTALFHNYPDQSNTFLDASSTALMAAVTYRLAVLTDGKSVSHIPDAERARKELSKYAGDAGGHVDGDGWLSPVVNPDNFPTQGSHSPEGEAFVISMQAGYMAWNAIGQPGVNAAGRSYGTPLDGSVVVAMAIAYSLLMMFF